MNIDAIYNGIVIDHIEAGKGMRLYQLLKLDELACTVAIIKNASSHRLGKKDIIKIDSETAIDFDIIGFVAPGATVNIIRNGTVEKRQVPMPKLLKGVLRCKNPRCITTTEQELAPIFKLSGDRYRCIYCEQELRVKPER